MIEPDQRALVRRFSTSTGGIRQERNTKERKVADQASSVESSAPDLDDELEVEPGEGGEDSEDSETQAAAADPTAKWAIRGAVVGVVAGGAAGAVVGALVARRPEALRQAGALIGGDARQIATAAGVAAAEVVASRGLNQFVTGDENGDRAQPIKQSAKEAGAAAAKAARDSLVSLRR